MCCLGEAKVEGVEGALVMIRGVFAAVTEWPEWVEPAIKAAWAALAVVVIAVVIGLCRYHRLRLRLLWRRLKYKWRRLQDKWRPARGECSSCTHA